MFRFEWVTVDVFLAFRSFGYFGCFEEFFSRTDPTYSGFHTPLDLWCYWNCGLDRFLLGLNSFPHEKLDIRCFKNFLDMNKQFCDMKQISRANNNNYIPNKGR